MRYVSIFSGIEAASVAWEPLGWEPVAFSEIEAFPSAVLKHRYPQVPNYGDITKIDWSQHSECISADVLVGGSPCQSFSIAGGRTGLDGASGLMWEYVRAVRELMPAWLVWENVPGALSSSHGEDFACLLRALDGLGYGLAWRVLDAQYYGVAQRRRRVFLVGSLGNTRCCDVLFEPDCLRWDHPTSREKRQALTRKAQSGPGGADDGGGCLTPWDMQSRSVYRPDGAWPTLDTRARSGGDGRAVALDYHPQDSRIRYADEDVSQTLSARMGTGGNNVPLVQETKSVAFLPNAGHKAGSMAVSEELSPTLKTDHNPAVYEIAGNAIGRVSRVNGGHHLGVCDPDDDGAYTLTTADRHAVCALAPVCATDSGSHSAIAEDLAPTLTAHEGKSASYVFSEQNSAKAGLSLDAETSPTLSATKQPTLSTRNLVRRLTPTECERLQGFKDGWTDVPYRGREHAPDSPRYKALGNSMAVPVMACIGRRIQQAEEGCHDVA